MRYIIPLTLLTLLFSCRKATDWANANELKKIYGTYSGKMDNKSYNTVKDTTTTFDTTFNTSITVSALTDDSIAVYITPYNRTFRIKYEGDNTTSGWSFISHPGGTEYWIKYNPDTDSATFYYNNYNTTYVKPVNANGYNYTFKGKKE